MHAHAWRRSWAGTQEAAAYVCPAWLHAQSLPPFPASVACSRVPELAAAHMQQEQGNQVQPGILFICLWSVGVVEWLPGPASAPTRAPSVTHRAAGPFLPRFTAPPAMQQHACLNPTPSIQAASMLLDDILASHLPTSRAPRLHAILLQHGAVCRPRLGWPAQRRLHGCYQEPGSCSVRAASIAL